MLIYHWREHSKRDSSSGALIEYLENFSAFAKFSKTIVTGMTIVWFVISVILLGAISGIFGNYIYSYLTSNEQSAACANASSIADELKKPNLTNTK